MRTALTIFVVFVLSIFGVSVWSQAAQYGPNNAITDVDGIKVGHHTAPSGYYTGTTVIFAQDGAVGGVDVRGSAPGTRETDLLNPVDLVEKANAIVLSGGSAYGLAAATGVMDCLESQGQGYSVGVNQVVPIVPSAILFDLGRCGTPFNYRPTAAFGLDACEHVATGPVQEGNIGAGTGAISGDVKGGIGTASVLLDGGIVVGAIVAVNSFGSTYDPDTGKLYAAFLEIDNEFGNLNPVMKGRTAKEDFSQQAMVIDKESPVKNTTIAVVATNAILTKAQAQKIAQMAHDGMARAIRPIHTMFDGDTIFALGTGKVAMQGFVPYTLTQIGSAAADSLSRAIVHAILAAESIPGCIKSYCDTIPNACNNSSNNKKPSK